MEDDKTPKMQRSALIVALLVIAVASAAAILGDNQEIQINILHSGSAGAPIGTNIPIFKNSTGYAGILYGNGLGVNSNGQLYVNLCNITSSNYIQPDVLVQYSNGVTVGYNATANTNVSRGLALQDAFTAANIVSGDTIYLKNESYDIGANAIFLNSTTNIALYGAGKNTTRIITTGVTTSAALEFGINSVIADLGIYIRQPSYAGGFGDERMLLGAQSSTNKPYGNDIVRNVYLLGNSDGLGLSSTTSYPNNNIYIYNLTSNTLWDAGVVSAANLNNVFIYDSNFTSNAIPIGTASSSDHALAVFQSNVVAVNTIFITYGRSIYDSDGVMVEFPGVVTLYGGSATATSSGLNNQGSTLLINNSVTYSSVTGVITFLNSNTIGSVSQEQQTNYWTGYAVAFPITAPATGTLAWLGVFGEPVTGNVETAIYSNSAGQPGTLLGSTPSSPVMGMSGWTNMTLTGVSLTAGTQYWLAFQESSPTLILSIGNSKSTARYVSQAYGTFPAGSAYTSSRNDNTIALTMMMVTPHGAYTYQHYPMTPPSPAAPAAVCNIGVTSLNTLKGNINITSANSNILVTTSGQNIILTSNFISTSTYSTTYTAGNGIAISASNIITAIANVPSGLNVTANGITLNVQSNNGLAINPFNALTISLNLPKQMSGGAGNWIVNTQSGGISNALGFGTAFTYKTASTNIIEITITGYGETTSTGAGTLQLIYGTGTAPKVNTSIGGGSLIGGATSYSGTPGNEYPISLTGIVFNAVVGTTYWFDLRDTCLGHSTCYFLTPEAIIQELPP